MPLASSYVSTIANIQSNGYFKRRYTEQVCSDLKEILVQYLTSFTDAELKTVKREDYERLITFATRLFESVRKKKRKK